MIPVLDHSINRLEERFGTAQYNIVKILNLLPKVVVKLEGSDREQLVADLMEIVKQFSTTKVISDC